MIGSNNVGNLALLVALSILSIASGLMVRLARRKQVLLKLDFVKHISKKISVMVTQAVNGLPQTYRL